MLKPMVDIVKSNRSVHGAAKMIRNFRQFPLGRRNGIKALPSIVKVYSRTMLPPVRLYSLCEAVERINADRIEGDIVECGVWSGGALALAALWDQRQPGSTRRYIGFDSFEGLPPPTPEDGEVFERFGAASKRKGRVVDKQLMRTGVCVGDAADTVRQFFAEVGVDRSRTVFYPGWFQDTLPIASREIGPIAILRVDGDWYDSTKVCLDHFYSHVPVGGFVIIDDYGAFSGCKRAVDEFREREGVTDKLEWVDNHVVMWRRS